MRKQLERPPKGDAKAMSKANRDLARDCESGLGLKDRSEPAVPAVLGLQVDPAFFARANIIVKTQFGGGA
ncbi:MAG TPA: hypothetical protein VNZ53_57620 [Steroidobacteraceae bacterium]|nr:hypothetical protein [Steroidobacteraceae bacterium]